MPTFSSIATDKHSPRGVYLIILSLWLMVFASSSQLMILSPILPELGKTLAIPTSLQGALVASYGLMMSVVALFIGPISDKVGRRKVLLWGCGTMTIALFLHLFAFDFYSMLVIRAISGAAGGLLSGVAVAFVGDFFEYERRGWANGWVMSGIAAGQVMGVPLGVALTGWFDFHAPFLMFGVLMGLAFLTSFLFVPQPEVKRNTDVLSIRHIGRQYLYFFRQPILFSAMSAYFLMFSSLLLFIVYLPTWITQQFGLNMQDIATMMMVGGVANVLIGPQMGKLSDRIGRKPLIIASCLGMALIMVGSTYFISSLLTGSISYFMAMVFVAMRISPLQALMSAIVPDESRGAFLSLAIGFGQIGGSIGSALAGWMFENWGYESNTFASAALISLMAFVVWRFLPEPEMPTK